MAKDMRMVAAMAVVVLLCAGQASASFRSCYNDCYEDCTAKAGEVTKCAAKCFFKCLKVAPVSGNPESCVHDCLCDRDCIFSECPRFGNDTSKVIDCAESCDHGRCKM